MKRSFLAALLLASAFSSRALADMNPSPYESSSRGGKLFSGEVFSGYFSGVAIHVSGSVANLAEGFPFEVRLGLGYAWVPVGDTVVARLRLALEFRSLSETQRRHDPAGTFPQFVTTFYRAPQ